MPPLAQRTSHDPDAPAHQRASRDGAEPSDARNQFVHRHHDRDECYPEDVHYSEHEEQRWLSQLEIKGQKSEVGGRRKLKH